MHFSQWIAILPDNWLKLAATKSRYITTIGPSRVVIATTNYLQLSAVYMTQAVTCFSSAK